MKNRSSLALAFSLLLGLLIGGAVAEEVISGRYVSVGTKISSLPGVILTGATSYPVKAEDDDLDLQTVLDSKTVKVNSRDYSQASGDSIGFQSKPNQNVTTTGSVYGGQVSPRCASAKACANLIGLEVSPILKGTSGNVSGDWRAADLILEDEGAGRTITGDAEFIRARPNLASTVTGDVMFAELLTAEGATNWELFASFPAVASVFVAPGNTSAISNAGYLKIKVGGTAYRLVVLEDE
jgi:hypothetical protein